MKQIYLLAAFVVLGACAEGAFSPNGTQNAALRTPPVADNARVGPQSPPADARTAEQFDTTSAQERAAATAPNGSASNNTGALLGTTVASLGNPADPGIWFRTPLVTQITQGRITFEDTSVNVELRPSGGVQGSASQISLPAMRLIGVPLTSLPEVTVHAS